MQPNLISHLPASLFKKDFISLFLEYEWWEEQKGRERVRERLSSRLHVEYGL